MDLLKTAVACGVTPEKFWRMTPAMVSLEIDGYYKKLRRERDDSAYFAWLNGLYYRAAMHPKRRYPDPPKASGTDSKAAIPMTEKEMKAIMRGLSKRGR